MAKKISAKLKANKIDLAEVERPARIIPEKQISQDKTVKIEISSKTIWLALGVILLFVIWKRIVPVFAILFFALIISSATLPIIKWLISKKIPKVLAVILVYLIVFIFILASVAIIIVPLFSELNNLLNNFPTIAEDVLNKLVELNIPFVNIDRDAIQTAVQAYISDLSSGLIPLLTQNLEGALQTLSTIAGILGGLLSLLTCMIISIYIVTDQDYLLDKILTRFFTETRKARVKKLVLDVENKLGRWVIGQVLLSIIVGALAWVLLAVFDVPLIMPLVVLAALMESVPTLGPILSSIPAILITLFAVGPIPALVVAIGFVIIHQTENVLLVPKIMGEVVGLRPIVVFIGLLFGYALGDIIGALLTVPLLGVGQILLDFYFDLQKMKAKGIV